MQESEREDELTDWLDGHGVRDSWQLAPVFVSAGTTPEFLDKLAAGAPPEMVEGAVRWLAYTVETELLLDEITDSVTRISTLVAAAKQYSQMDRAPFERADIHDGIKSTLTMMAGKLAGLSVVKELDRTLPPVPVYGGELNQVWTNLIDNAVQAMDGDGDPDDPHVAGRRPRAGGDRRHRAWHPTRAAAAHLRAVLHHQAGR